MRVVPWARMRDEVRLAWLGDDAPAAIEAWWRAHGGTAEPVRLRMREEVLDTDTGIVARAGLVLRACNRAGVRTIEVTTVPIDPDLAWVQEPVATALRADDDLATAARELVSHRLALTLDEAPRVQFVTIVDRERRALRTAELDAELRVDRIDVEMPDGRACGRIGDLALEVRSGSTASVAAIVQALGELPGVESTSHTVIERAREIVGLPAIEWPGRAPELDPDAPLGEAARSLLQALWSAALRHEAGARAALDPEQIHKMRVAMRRLRTALRVFAGAFEGAPLSELRDELRWLGRLLGEVRDFDVHRLALPQWRTRFSEAPAEGWVELDRRMAARRRLARTRLREGFASERRAALDALALRCLSAPATASTTVASAAPRLVGDQIARCRSALGKLRSRGTVELAHRLRIRVKNLRYTLEFLRRTAPDRFAASAKVLADLQTELGNLQDAVQTGRLARELALVEPAGAVTRHALGALVGFGLATEHAVVALAEAAVESADLDDRLRTLDGG